MMSRRHARSILLDFGFGLLFALSLVVVTLPVVWLIVTTSWGLIVFAVAVTIPALWIIGNALRPR